MAHSPGNVLLIQYNEKGTSTYYHERLVMMESKSDPGCYAAMTPDRDVYVEDYSKHNANVKKVVPISGMGVIPRGVSAKKIYGFADKIPTEEELEQGMRVAAALCGAAVPAVAFWRKQAEPLVPARADDRPASPALPLGDEQRDFTPGPIQVAEPRVTFDRGEVRAFKDAATPGARYAGAGGVYLLTEPTLSFEIGDAFKPPLNAPTIAGSGKFFVEIEGEGVVLQYLAEGSDITEYISARKSFLNVDRRTIACPTEDDGRSVANLIGDMRVAKGGLGSGIAAESTAPWFIARVAETGSGFLQRHHTWRHESGVSASMPLVFEHEMLSTGFDLAIGVDRLNIKNLACFEWFIRRMQLHEHAVLENPLAPSYEGARHFMGKGNRRGGALIAPELHAYVASELGKESAILREKRKAREARTAEKGKPGKGGGPAGGKPGKGDA